MKGMDKWSVIGYTILAFAVLMFVIALKNYFDSPVVQVSVRTGEPVFLKYPNGTRATIQPGQNIAQYETEFIN